jgi:hypothetical protein
MKGNGDKLVVEMESVTDRLMRDELGRGGCWQGWDV